MSTLKVIGSGSSGNGYILSTSKGTLLLEAGVPYKEILRGLDYKIVDAVGVLVTHSHLDHLQPSAITNLSRSGIPIYGTRSCAEKCPQVRVLQPKMKFKIGEFEVMPLKVPHDEKIDTYSYVIRHEEFGTLLFATDLSRFPYNTKSLPINHLLIEANYDENIIVEAMCNNAEIRSVSERHLSIEDCIATIRRFSRGQINSLILLHLSSSFSNEREFAERVYVETGIKPYVASQGLTVELNKDDF